MLADRLLLFPQTGERQAFGATEHHVETPVGRMQVWVARSPSSIGRTPRRYVLHLVGNGSRAEPAASWIASRWGDEPAEVWALNWPGYGDSEGPAKLASLPVAASAVYDAMADAAGDETPLFVDGDSMGTTVALHLAATKRTTQPVAGLVLKNPPPLRQLILQRHGWYNLWLVAGPLAASIPGELNAIANAKQSHVPAVFLEATEDSLIPPAFQQLIQEAYAGRVRVVKLDGADHNTPISAEEETELRAAIAELMTPRGDVDLP